MRIKIKVGEVELEVDDGLSLHEDSMPSMDNLAGNFSTLIGKANTLLEKCEALNRELNVQ